MAVVPDVAICRHCVYGERFALPGPGRVVVNVGDTVTPADVVGFAVERGGIRVVDVAAALHLPARRIQEFLVIKEGQSVRAGELLAQRQGMVRSLQARAPADSRAMAVGAGMVVLESFPSERPIRGAIPGRVLDVIAGEGLVIEDTGAILMASAIMGGDFAGPVKMAAPVPERVLRAEHIDATCHGTIIVGGIGDDAAALKRAADFGAQGVILGSVPSSWARQPLPLPVVITESYGQAPMNRLAFDTFGELAGSLVFAVRRGSRVWVVSPDGAGSGTRYAGTGVTQIGSGTLVRICSGAQAGSVAEVVESLPGGGEVILRTSRDRLSVSPANLEAIVR